MAAGDFTRQGKDDEGQRFGLRVFGEILSTHSGRRLHSKKTRPAGSPSGGPLRSYADITGTYQRPRKAIRGAQWAGGGTMTIGGAGR